MEGKDLADWQAFEIELQGLRARYKEAPSRLLFRGVSDSEYPLTTTLERKGFLFLAAGIMGLVGTRWLAK
jgi:hypothetical protein